MKVCLISRYFDFKNAGIGRVSLEIRKELIKRGHKVATLETKGTSLYSYFLYTLLGIPLRLPRGYDIYHALTPMEAMWLPKNKSIVTFHDLFQITDKDKLGSGIGYSNPKNFIGTNYFRFACKVAKRCKGVVAVSEKTKADLVTHLGIKEDKITVINSGIRGDLEPWKKRDGKFRIGYLGQLDRRKRLNLLIDAFKKSKLEELVIGGIGADEEILKEQAGGNDKIKFLGLVPDEKLPAFYNSLDVFIFPTWIEGYGLPIVEAMACKKPVVVLDDAIIPREVKSRCVVVERLEYVLGNQKYLENLCRYVDIEGNYLFAKEHTWERCVDSYIELYKEVNIGK